MDDYYYYYYTHTHKQSEWIKNEWIRRFFFDVHQSNGRPIKQTNRLCLRLHLNAFDVEDTKWIGWFGRLRLIWLKRWKEEEANEQTTKCRVVCMQRDEEQRTDWRNDGTSNGGWNGRSGAKIGAAQHFCSKACNKRRTDRVSQPAREREREK